MVEEEKPGPMKEVKFVLESKPPRAIGNAREELWEWELKSEKKGLTPYHSTKT